MNILPKRRITFFIPFFNAGGVERMLFNLARGVAEEGIAVDFVVIDAAAVGDMGRLPDAVNVIEVGSRDRGAIIQTLIRNMAERKPGAVLSAKDACDLLAVAAIRRADADIPLYIRAVVNVSQRLARRSPLKRWWNFRQLRAAYGQTAGIIAVSRGVADDIRRITGVPGDRLHVAPNPVVTPELEHLAAAPVDHPWFARKELPIVIGSGRLGRQKNFALLIRAFAKARASRPCRLVLLGAGRQHDPLQRLARQLGVADSVWLAGYVTNPYAYMGKADVFALSSRWEGSPNVLTEALALGLAAVATDCPSGPREILQDGRLGTLVPLDDEDALAAALVSEIENPTATPEQRRAATQPYHYRNSARHYLQAMRLT